MSASKSLLYTVLMSKYDKLRSLFNVYCIGSTKIGTESAYLYQLIIYFYKIAGHSPPKINSS